MNCRHLFFRLAFAGLLCGKLAMPAEAQPVTGYVDLHSHLAAELSFGGSFYWGKVEGPMDQAVRRCDGNPFRSHAATMWPGVSELIGADMGWHFNKRNGYDPRRCAYAFWFIPIPGTCPKPHFEDWPMWNAIAHQQMWQGWLQQAHQGGLQIMVVSLAESELLCINTPPERRRFDCNEMTSVQRQATFTRDFAARNSSWVGIATSPAQARTLIAQGKLALVLAVEVTKLFPGGDFVAQLDQLRALGVRSVQVVHHANNRFGGAAPIPEIKKAADVTEALWGTFYNIPEITAINNIVCRNSAGFSGTCDGETYLNEQGLKPEGSDLVRAMMDRGMLVDVAHLSRKSFVDAYNIAIQRGYPLLYSHAHIWDTILPSAEHKKHEKYIRDDEIHMITSTGGMVGLRTGPEPTVAYGPSPVENRCQGSARSFAQSLMYAVDRGLTVGFGADLNGFIQQLKPRFSPASVLLSNGNCTQDFFDISGAGGPTELQKKGLAHVGLLPALMTDLQAVGVPSYYLDHLNRSAENFLLMWEHSESLATIPSNTNLARLAAVSTASTYCASPGEHCYSAARVNDGDTSTALGGFHSWTNAWGAAMPQTVELSWGSPVTLSSVVLYTTAGYEIRDYDIQYLQGSTWTTLLQVRNNVSAMRADPINPRPVTTIRLRVVGYLGPAHQPGYVRINEIEVY